nr:MAG TPA: hypothetical protein [Caudoviricetes sp.]
MDKFCFVAIMLFAIQRDMINYSIDCVIKCIDKYRGTMSRINYLELIYSDALYEHTIHDVSFGIYDKYFDNQQFLERIWPL